MELKPVDQFIESWGALGVLWGINRSMARIQALILVSEDPLTLDDISDRLSISRSNVSMSLRELRSWGVIKKVNVPGDRRDYFAIEPDTWTILFRIARERKRREFDPALQALRDTLDPEQGAQGEKVRGRLKEMEEIMSTMDQIANNVLSDQANAQNLLKFFSNFIS